MILPKFGRNGTVIVAGEPQPILDGYGVVFDPNMHALYMRAAKGDEAFVPPPPSEPQYESPKDKPAGWWQKENKMGSGL